MATFAIGDIHGNARGLEDLLGEIGPQVSAGDTVVFLGDYVDRGPDSRGCIDLILKFQASTPGEVVCLLGNHEDWMLRTRGDHTDHGWLSAMEGLTTVASYSAEACSVIEQAAAESGALYARTPLPYDAFWRAVPPSHVEWLRGLRPAHETADCVCVHAGLHPGIAAVGEQPVSATVWGRGTRGFPRGYKGSKPVVYGHHNNAELTAAGWPLPNRLGRAIGLDTSAHGVVSAVRLPEDVLFQSQRHSVDLS